mgnify:CR=1 FL=1
MYVKFETVLGEAPRRIYKRIETPSLAQMPVALPCYRKNLQKN